MNLQDSISQQMSQIDPSTLPWVKCTCGGSIFTSGVMVKRLSQLLSPTRKEEILPVEVIICATCNKIPDFYSSRISDIPSDLVSKNIDNE